MRPVIGTGDWDSAVLLVETVITANMSHTRYPLIHIAVTTASYRAATSPQHMSFDITRRHN